MRFTAILAYLSVSTFHIIIVSHARYDAHDFYYFAPMWGSEVAKFKTKIHLKNTPTEVTWACDVTTTEREGEFTSLGICYFVW